MTASPGNCYICGATLGKVALKNHILKEHNDPTGEQACRLLKIEGAYDKNFWLLIDVPGDSALASVDIFLRKIWLECCGHLSAFRGSRDDVDKNRKWGMLPVGAQLVHVYDFGTTTECLITIVSETRRKKQQEPVRLLARNVPSNDVCAVCGNDASVICCECMWDEGNPCYCDVCAEGHEHDITLPLTNSPRCGECGYDGEQDVYTFDPAKVAATVPAPSKKSKPAPPANQPKQKQEKVVVTDELALAEEIKAHLPLYAYPTKQLVQELKSKGFKESRPLGIESVSDFGEEGGLMCHIRHGEEVLIVSATNLRFADDTQICRDINDYIDTRVEWLKQQHLMETVRNAMITLGTQDSGTKCGRNEPCPCGSGKKFKHCCGSLL